MLDHGFGNGYECIKLEIQGLDGLSLEILLVLIVMPFSAINESMQILSSLRIFDDARMSP